MDPFLDSLGAETLVALSPAYQQGERLQEVVGMVHDRLEQLRPQTGGIVQALHELTGRDAVRVMTLHKAKGMEFDVVVVPAVEERAFLGDAQQEELLRRDLPSAPASSPHSVR